MATLAEMRRKVYTRLRDWGGDVWNEFELNQIINEAQDNFTRDTGYLRSVIISPIVDGQSVYTLSPPAGYRIGDTLSVIYYDGVRDYPALIPVSLRQLELMSPDYRHVSGSVPMYVVRNFNPETLAPTKDTFYLYPTPDMNDSLYSGTWPINITGGGGAGAAGTATFTNGIITATTVTFAGNNYTTQATGTLATTNNNTQFVTGSGVILTPVTYTGIGAVTITNPGSGINLNYSGTPYTGTWPMYFAGGNPGTSAAATATITAGVVTSVQITNYGSNYTSSAPFLFLSNSNPGGDFWTASVQPIFSVAPSPLNISSITITNAGSGYVATSKRLRVNVTLMTDGQLTADDTEMALPERIAEEAIINYAVAEAFVRESLSAPDKADVYIKQSQYYRQRYDQAMVRAAAEAKTGFDRGMNTVRGWWV